VCEVATISSPANVLVYSKGGPKSSGTSDVYVLSPRRAVEILTTAKRARATLTVKHATGGAEVQPVYQTTNDGDDWSQPVPLGEFRQGDGVSTSAWVDLGDIGARGIRFGAVVRQAKGSQNVELCRVTQIIDFEIK
jgi:hypothetical protein